MLDLDAIRRAHDRIRPYIHRTPVLTSDRLDTASGASLFFKCENFQKVGAFKARGATNAVFSLMTKQRSAVWQRIRRGTMRRLFRARRSCAALRPTS